MAQENEIMRISGDVYVFPIVGGVEQGGIGPLPAKFSYSAIKMVEVLDTRKGKRGHVIAALPEMQVLEAELEVITVPKAVLAMFSQSAITTITEAAVAAATTPAEFDCTVDRWTKLPHRNVNTVVIGDDDTVPPTTVYVAGTDYELNAAMGMFRPLPGGAMALVTSAFASYKAGAVSGQKISVSSECDTIARIEIDGRNEACASSAPIICKVAEARLRPKDSFTFDDEKPKTLKFEVKVQGDPPAIIEFPVLAEFMADAKVEVDISVIGDANEKLKALKIQLDNVTAGSAGASVAVDVTGNAINTLGTQAAATVPQVTGTGNAINTLGTQAAATVPQVTGTGNAINTLGTQAAATVPQVTGTGNAINTLGTQAAATVPQVTGTGNAINTLGTQAAATVPQVTGTGNAINTLGTQAAATVPQVTGTGNAINTLGTQAAATVPQVTGTGNAINTLGTQAAATVPQVTGTGNAINTLGTQAAATVPQVTGTGNAINTLGTQAAATVPQVTGTGNAINTLGTQAAATVPQVTGTGNAINTLGTQAAATVPQVTGTGNAINTLGTQAAATVPQVTGTGNAINTLGTQAAATVPQVTGTGNAINTLGTQAAATVPQVTGTGNAINTLGTQAAATVPQVTGTGNAINTLGTQAAATVPQVTGTGNAINTLGTQAAATVPQVTGTGNAINTLGTQAAATVPQVTGTGNAINTLGTQAAATVPQVTGTGNAINTLGTQAAATVPQVTGTGNAINTLGTQAAATVPQVTGTGNAINTLGTQAAATVPQVTGTGNAINTLGTQAAATVPQVTGTGNAINTLGTQAAATVPQVTGTGNAINTLGTQAAATVPQVTGTGNAINTLGTQAAATVPQVTGTGNAINTLGTQAAATVPQVTGTGNAINTLGTQAAATVPQVTGTGNAINTLGTQAAATVPQVTGTGNAINTLGTQAAATVPQVTGTGNAINTLGTQAAATVPQVTGTGNAINTLGTQAAATVPQVTGTGNAINTLGTQAAATVPQVTGTGNAINTLGTQAAATVPQVTGTGNAINTLGTQAAATVPQVTGTGNAINTLGTQAAATVPQVTGTGNAINTLGTQAAATVPQLTGTGNAINTLGTQASQSTPQLTLFSTSVDTLDTAATSITPQLNAASNAINTMGTQSAGTSPSVSVLTTDANQLANAITSQLVTALRTATTNINGIEPPLNQAAAAATALNTDAIQLSNTLLVQLTAALRKADGAASDITPQLQKMAAETKGLDGDTGVLSNTLEELRNTLLAAFAIEKFQESINDWQNLQNRIKQTAGSTEEFEQAMSGVISIANDTKSTFQAVGDVYFAVSKSVNGSMQSILNLTSTISKAAALSGTSVENQADAIRQLGQALNSGALRGDEFNSVNENTNRIIQVLKDSLGKTTGELRAMAEAGELTSDVVLSALSDQAAKVGMEYEQMGVTIGQSVQLLQNAFVESLGSFGDATGATWAVSEAIQALAGHMDKLIYVVGTGGLAAAFMYLGNTAYNTLNSLPDIMTQATAEMKTKLEELEASYKKSNDALELQLTTQQQEAELTRQSVASKTQLINELNAAEKSYNAFGAAGTKVETDLEAVVTTLTKKKNETVRSYNETLKNHEDALANNTEKVYSLERRTTTYSASLTTARKKILELEANLKTAQDAVTAAGQSMQTGANESAAYAGGIEKIKERLKEAEIDLATTNTLLDKQQTSADETKLKINELATEHGKSTKKVRESITATEANSTALQRMQAAVANNSLTLMQYISLIVSATGAQNKMAVAIMGLATAWTYLKGAFLGAAEMVAIAAAFWGLGKAIEYVYDLFYQSAAAVKAYKAEQDAAFKAITDSTGRLIDSENSLIVALKNGDLAFKGAADSAVKTEVELAKLMANLAAGTVKWSELQSSIERGEGALKSVTNQFAASGKELEKAITTTEAYKKTLDALNKVQNEQGDLLKVVTENAGNLDEATIKLVAKTAGLTDAIVDETAAAELRNTIDQKQIDNTVQIINKNEELTKQSGERLALVAAEIEKEKEIIAELEKEIAATKQKSAANDKEKNQLANIIESLEKSVDSRKSSIESLNTETDKIKAATTKREEETLKLLEFVAKQQMEIQSREDAAKATKIQEDAIKDLTGTVDAYRDAWEAARATMTKADGQNINLTDSMEKLSKKAEEATKKDADAKDELALRTQQLTDATKNLSDAVPALGLAITTNNKAQSDATEKAADLKQAQLALGNAQQNLTYKVTEESTALDKLREAQAKVTNSNTTGLFPILELVKALNEWGNAAYNTSKEAGNLALAKHALNIKLKESSDASELAATAKRNLEEATKAAMESDKQSVPQANAAKVATEALAIAKTNTAIATKELEIVTKALTVTQGNALEASNKLANAANDYKIALDTEIGILTRAVEKSKDAVDIAEKESAVKIAGIKHLQDTAKARGDDTSAVILQQEALREEVSLLGKQIEAKKEQLKAITDQVVALKAKANIDAEVTLKEQELIDKVEKSVAVLAIEIKSLEQEIAAKKEVTSATNIEAEVRNETLAIIGNETSSRSDLVLAMQRESKAAADLADAKEEVASEAAATSNLILNRSAEQTAAIQSVIDKEKAQIAVLKDSLIPAQIKAQEATQQQVRDTANEAEARHKLSEAIKANGGSMEGLGTLQDDFLAKNAIMLMSQQQDILATEELIQAREKYAAAEESLANKTTIIHGNHVQQSAEAVTAIEAAIAAQQKQITQLQVDLVPAIEKEILSGNIANNYRTEAKLSFQELSVAIKENGGSIKGLEGIQQEYINWSTLANTADADHKRALEDLTKTQEQFGIALDKGIGLYASLSRAKGEQTTAEKNLTAATNEYNAAQQALADINKKVQEEMLDSTNGLDGYRIAWERSKDALIDAQNSHTRTEASIASLSGTIVAKTTDNSKAQTDYADKAKLAEDATRLLTDAQTKLADATSNLELATKNNNKAQEDAIGLDTKIANAKRMLEKSQADLSKATADAFQMEAEYKKIQEDVNNGTIVGSMATIDITIQKGRLENATNLLVAAMDKHRDAETNLNSLSKLASDTDATAAKTKKDLEIATQKLADAKTQLATKTDDSKFATEDATDAQINAATAAKELELATKANSESQGKAKESAQALADAKQKLEDAARNYATALDAEFKIQGEAIEKSKNSIALQEKESEVKISGIKLQADMVSARGDDVAAAVLQQSALREEIDLIIKQIDAKKEQTKAVDAQVDSLKAKADIDGKVTRSEQELIDKTQQASDVLELETTALRQERDAKMAAANAGTVAAAAAKEHAEAIQREIDASQTNIGLIEKETDNKIKAINAAINAAKARGDETGAADLAADKLKIEIELLIQQIEQKRAQAEATRELAAAKEEEAKADGTYTDEEQAAVEATKASAEALDLEAESLELDKKAKESNTEATRESESVTWDLASALSKVGMTLNDLGDSASGAEDIFASALASMTENINSLSIATPWAFWDRMEQAEATARAAALAFVRMEEASSDAADKMTELSDEYSNGEISLAEYIEELERAKYAFNEMDDATLDDLEAEIESAHDAMQDLTESIAGELQTALEEAGLMTLEDAVLLENLAYQQKMAELEIQRIQAQGNAQLEEMINRVIDLNEKAHNKKLEQLEEEYKNTEKETEYKAASSNRDISNIEKEGEAKATQHSTNMRYYQDEYEAKKKLTGDNTVGTLAAKKSGTDLDGATGADFVVPAGYPNDSFIMGVQSGEHVKVTPADEVKKGNAVSGRTDSGEKVIRLQWASNRSVTGSESSIDDFLNKLSQYGMATT